MWFGVSKPKASKKPVLPLLLLVHPYKEVTTFVALSWWSKGTAALSHHMLGYFGDLFLLPGDDHSIHLSCPLQRHFGKSQVVP